MLGFLLLGAIQAAYGPAFPGLVRRFDVGLDLLGQAVALHFAGSFLTIALTGPLLVRIGYRRPLALGALVMLAAAVVVAWAPSLPWLFVGATLGGLGFGMTDVALNLLIARSFAPNAAPALNLVNAFFGVGSVATPVAIALSGGGIVAAMGIVAVVAAVMVPLAWSLDEPSRPSAVRGRVPWFAAAGFLLMYFIYVSGEVGVGTWETVHLAPFIGERAAAFNASVYWAALTVGRLLAIPISARVAPATLVVSASCLAFLGAAAAHVPSLAPFAYPFVGLALAPIFPTGLAWLQRVFPSRSETIASAVLAAATLGPVATSGAFGGLVERFGSAVVPSVLTVVIGAGFVVSLVLRLGTRSAQTT